MSFRVRVAMPGNSVVAMPYVPRERERELMTFWDTSVSAKPLRRTTERVQRQISSSILTHVSASCGWLSNSNEREGIELNFVEWQLRSFVEWQV